MYIPGTIIYFTPFYFSDGSSKNKYFIVLADTGNDILVAGLPTSQDHIPSSVKKKHGCISDYNKRVSCYFFEKGRIISECGLFGFPRNTYLYGEQISFFDIKRLQSLYANNANNCKVLCKLSDTEFESVKKCLRNSGVVAGKFKKYMG